MRCAERLAALGEPVLNEVKFLLHKEDLQEEERLWLLAALYEIGDQQVARSNANMHGLEILFRQKPV